MGIYDRDYYREPSPRWAADLGNSGTVWIMATTIVLFFVQAFIRHPAISPLAEWGQFHFGKVAELGQLAAHAYGGQLIALQVGYQGQVMAAQVEAVGRFFAKGKQLQVVRKPLFGDDGNLAIR